MDFQKSRWPTGENCPQRDTGKPRNHRPNLSEVLIVSVFTLTVRSKPQSRILVNGLVYLFDSQQSAVIKISQL